MPLANLLGNPTLTQSHPRFGVCVQNRRETAGAADGRRRGVRNRKGCECLRELHKVCTPVFRGRALTRAGTADTTLTVITT